MPANRLSLSIAALFLVPCALAAQSVNTDTASTSFPVQLNLSNPGARSLGLGGAFVALADDATAAFANPAGLTNLSRPEVSAEGRHWKYTSVYPNSGHAFATHSGTGVDTTDGIHTAEADNSLNGLSFLSVTYPYKQWSFAFYRHELVNFQADVTAQGAFVDALGTPNNTFVTFRVLPSKTRYDLQVVSYGLASGFRITDRISAGVTLNYYDFSLQSLTARYNVPNRAPGFYEAPDYSDGNITNVLSERGNEKKFGGSFGLLWKVTDNWSLGTVYRRGAKFSTAITATNINGSTSTAGSQKVPDTIVLGTAFKPTDQITVTVDATRIRYSGSLQDQVRIDDANEAHFGVEYVLLPPSQPKHPISFRLGAWLDPDHQPSYRGLPDASIGQRRLAVLFLRGEDEWHVSGGLGYVLGERFQIDAAYDHSNLTSTFSLSTVYRF